MNSAVLYNEKTMKCICLSTGKKAHFKTDMKRQKRDYLNVLCGMNPYSFPCSYDTCYMQKSYKYYTCGSDINIQFPL